MHRLHTLDMQIETETQTAIGKITLILFGHENQEEKKSAVGSWYLLGSLI